MAKLSNLIAISSQYLAIVICILSWSVPVSVGSNVLAVLPSVWRSHYIFGRRLLQQLVVQQNHTVTLLSPHCTKDNLEHTNNSTENNATVPRIREIHIDKLLENWIDMGLSFDIEQAHQQSMLERFTRLIYAGTANADLLLANGNVRKLVRSNEKFDLLIIDLFLSDALLGFAFYYEIPTVVISPNGANTWLNRMIGNPQSSALDPSNFLPYMERMSVWERCSNTLMGLFEKLTYNFFHMISQQAVYLKHFQTLYQLANNTTVSLPHHRDLTQNLSLILLNSHPVIQYPRAFLPNVISVGGVHLQNDSIALPNHLKSFIEAPKNGVIYISFGADARTVDLAREKLDALFDVISYMEETNFLLKWEVDEHPKNLPPNVLLNDWFPQEQILAHPNVKVFVTTCGLMSVLESINGLTPLLAIPIYPEQVVTATKLQSRGLAVIVKFDAITYDTLLNNIKELLENTSYKRDLKMARTLLTGDYGTPTAKSLHYINLVLRTKGADHLKTHAHHLNFLRANFFDVIAIISLGLGGILAIPFLLICCILKRSYYSQGAAKATTNATAVANNTTLHHSRSKVSLVSATTNANNGNVSPKQNNLKVGLMTTTVSVPSSLKDASEAVTSPRKAATRRLSASALWTTNIISTPASLTATPSTCSSNTSFFPTSAGPPNNNKVNITKTT